MKSQLSRKSLTIILLGMLTLLLQRLATLLLDGAPAWVASDLLRALFGVCLSYAVVQFVDWRDLRWKCLCAAIFGFCVADLIVCCLWYLLKIGGFKLAATIESVLFIGFAALYWVRSYDEKSDYIDDDSVYCLRRKPHVFQDFLIALAGCFGAYGGYAVCVEKQVYMFHRGKLRQYDVENINTEKYHVTKGGKGKKESLESMVNMPWSLSINCLTLLRGFWKSHRRIKE